MRHWRTTIALLLLLSLAGLGSWSLLRPITRPPAVAEPAPRHHFAPISPSWRMEEHLIRPIGDPIQGYEVVALKDRDRTYSGYLTQRAYFEKGDDGLLRRFVCLYPSGKPQEEIDYVGPEDQYTRNWYADGKSAGHSHSRTRELIARLVSGESISPDGKMRHRVVGGKGELVTYGQKPGNRIRRWYNEGDPVVELKFEDNQLVHAMLTLFVEVGSIAIKYSRLIATPEEESLQVRLCSWRRTRQGEVTLTPPPGFGATGGGLGSVVDWRPAYREARAEFFYDLGPVLQKAGLSWQRLGIDFLRLDRPWPASARQPGGK